MPSRGLLLLTSLWSVACALPGLGAQTAETAPAARPTETRLFIREIRVKGATLIPSPEIQKAVYPFVGPARTLADLDAAREALQKLYQEKGYQSAQVEIPPQNAGRGVLFLKVSEARVGKLRVVGSRYNDVERIRDGAPSLREGTVPDFNQVSRDIVALNQRPDRRVTPEIRPGAASGTIDVDLKVEDSPPLSASVELNNRYSADTTRLRLNASASYDNLWQAGHALGGSLQTSPESWFDEVMVYSGFYRAPVSGSPDWTVQASATKQDSNISTLGGAAVAGRGEIYSLRATRVLPSSPGFYHSASMGLERKHFVQQVNSAGANTRTPVLYFPLGFVYSGFLDREKVATEFYLGATLNVRGLGSDSREFDANRFDAEPGFLTLRGDVSQNWKLGGGFTLTPRLQGQVASGPLISNEQFAAGGLDTVRGYLEGDALGDFGGVAGLEAATPSLLAGKPGAPRLTAHVFAEAGLLYLGEALPEQTDHFELASVGVGLRAGFTRHLDGSLNFAVPLLDEGRTEAGDVHVIFVIRGQL